MKIRKFISICIAAFMLIPAVLAFTACASSGAEGTTGGAADRAETADTASASNADAQPDASVKAANGEITVYTALEDEQVTEYLAVFNAEYPNITVNIVRESTGIITARLLAEKDNP
jgi:iron(III) transport system substrate-binding protein